MADQDPNRDHQDPNVEEPGDTDSADIVDRTGEQMPRQSHEGIDPDDASLPKDHEKEPGPLNERDDKRRTRH